MKATRIIAATTLVSTVVLAVHAAHAQQVGGERGALICNATDLSVTGREVVQTIVELEPGTTAPRHSHRGEPAGPPRGPASEIGDPA